MFKAKFKNTDFLGDISTILMLYTLVNLTLATEFEI